MKQYQQCVPLCDSGSPIWEPKASRWYLYWEGNDTPPTSQGQNSRQDYHMCIFCCPDICHVLFCISHGRFLSDHPSNNITIWNINRRLPSGVSCHTMCQSNLLIKVTWFLFWLFNVAIRTHEQSYWLFTAINKS